MCNMSRHIFNVNTFVHPAIIKSRRSQKKCNSAAKRIDFHSVSASLSLSLWALSRRQDDIVVADIVADREVDMVADVVADM